MVTLAFFILLTISVTGNTQAQGVNKIQKCCPKGMQLGPNVTCIREEGREISNLTEEEFRPPIDENANYWIPPLLRNNHLLVQYNTSATFEKHFLTVKQYEENEDFSEFYSSVHPHLIKADQDCFDTLVGGKVFVRVHVRSLGVKPIFKCCQKGERLNEHINACESILDISKGKEISEEKISVLDSHQWLPGNYSHPFLLVKYNALHSSTFPYNYVFSEKRLDWQILSTFPTWNAMLLINGTDISGKSINGITNHFCFDEVARNSIIHRVLLAYIPKKRVLYKCCPNGMYYDLTTKNCVEGKVTNDLLQANIQNQLLFPLKNNWENNWIPPPFLHSPTNTYLSYYALNGIRYYHVTVFLKNFLTIEYNNLDGIDLALVRKTVFCYEATINPFLSLIFMNGFVTKSINKCCPFGKRLNPQANKCLPISGYTKKDADNAMYGWLQPTQSWFPLTSPQQYYPVASNYIKEKLEFNIIEVEKSDNNWKFISTKGENSAIQLRSQDIKNNSLSGSTDKYCFDEIDKGNATSRVLLALIYHVRKCCPKGTQVDNKFLCSKRSATTTEDITKDQIDWNNNANNYWIPTSFKERNISVIYGDLSFSEVFKNGGVFANESNWELVYGLNTIPTLLLYLSDLKGNQRTIESNRFCFDYLSNVGKAAFFHSFPGPYTLRKCCSPGEVFSHQGVCVKHDGVDWSPGKSNFSDRLNLDSFKEHILIPLSLVCGRKSFSTYSAYSSRWERYVKGEYRVEGRYSETLYCNDWQLTKEGHLEEVIGACTRSESGWVLEKVRPLGFVAIFFLLAAVVVALVKEDLRRSAHGRALVCHALSIASYVTIQMVVYLTPSSSVSPQACLPYAYSAYFFLSAAHWWLMIFTYNVFSNFRKPLGAMAVKAKNDSKESKAVWRRFGMMSLIAWGGAGTITAIATAMHQNVQKVFAKGLIAPTFWETRTCTTEYIVTMENGKKTGQYINTWGTLCYYFIPTSLLILTNLGFVIVTSIKIREISKGTSILRKDAGNNSACVPWHRMERVFVYAKLLLLTGLLELVLEIASWSTGFENVEENKLWESKSFIFLNILTFLDVFRGILVFWLSTGRKFEVVQWFIFVRTRLIDTWLNMNIRLNELARNLKSRRVEPQKDDSPNNDIPIQEIQVQTKP